MQYNYISPIPFCNGNAILRFPHSVSCIFTPLLLSLTFIIAVYLDSRLVTSRSTRQYYVHEFTLSICARTSCIFFPGCFCSIFPVVLYMQCPSPITLIMSPSFCVSCFTCVRIPLLFICFGVVLSFQSFDVFVYLSNSRSVYFSLWPLIFQWAIVAICDILFLCIFSNLFISATL